MKIEKWYDKQTRSWVVQTKDMQNNQIGEAHYSGTKAGADAEVTKRISECPYCESRVEPTDEHRYVNGIRPVRDGEGCEFCEPEKVMREFGIYDKNNYALGVVDAETTEEALTIFKAGDAKAEHYGEGYWAEELDA